VQEEVRRLVEYHQQKREPYGIIYDRKGDLIAHRLRSGHRFLRGTTGSPKGWCRCFVADSGIAYAGF
jgi:hypothetical protein